MVLLITSLTISSFISKQNSIAINIDSMYMSVLLSLFCCYMPPYDRCQLKLGEKNVFFGKITQRSIMCILFTDVGV